MFYFKTNNMAIQIIHFKSPTCSVCVNQDQVLADLHKEIDLPYRSLMITTHFAEALQYGVKSAPTLVFVDTGRALAVKPGFQSRENILSQLHILKES
jgi:predicted DsbA family dithiol-disulfide isomerase